MSTMPCILWLSGTALGQPIVPVVHTLLVEGWAARAGRPNPGLSDITTPAQALALMKLIDATYESARTGKAVTIA